MSNNKPRRVLTVRNVPSEVDEAIAVQARVLGRSKSELVQELLSATFGDPVGNFIRGSELVFLMDRELAKATGATLAQSWTEGAVTPAEGREWCRLLGIKSADDLQRMLIAAMPWLALRARQLKGPAVLPRGISLRFALLVEAAGRDLDTLLSLHRTLYAMVDEERFLMQVSEIRDAMRLPSLERPAS
jgi:hypothetical protein